MLTKTKAKQNGHDKENATAVVESVKEEMPVASPEVSKITNTEASSEALPPEYQTVTPGKLRKGKRNAFVWIHPDRVGGLSAAGIQVDILKPQANQVPKYYCYSFWDMGSRKPVWWWYEKKYINTITGEITYICVPYEPEADESLSAREVRDACEWKPAQRYKQVKNKFGQVLKLGMLMIFAGILIVALFLIANP